MGNLVSNILERLATFGTKDARILMVGLDAAGKTSILYKLKLDEYVQTIPTIGFNVETVEYKKIRFTMWDVGGQHLIRKLWRHYYQGTDAVIFVVDSNDVQRMGEVKDELMNMMNDEMLKNAKLLVFANKMDLPRAMKPLEMKDVLDLKRLKNNWYLQPCCATTGEGLFEGLDWLSNQL